MVKIDGTINIKGLQGVKYRGVSNITLKTAKGKFYIDTYLDIANVKWDEIEVNFSGAVLLNDKRRIMGINPITKRNTLKALRGSELSRVVMIASDGEISNHLGITNKR